MNVLFLFAATFVTAVEPLHNEKWWGATVNYGAQMPFGETNRVVDIGLCGGAAAPFLVSSEGRYVWSDRPFSFSFDKGVLKLESKVEKLAPITAGSTLKEAYLAASAKHFPFSGTTPAELLFTKPQWNNWIEIAIQGMKQSSVDAYTEALAESGFPCGVYMMDGGWFSHQGSYQFHAPDFPDPKGMFRRIREKGWKSMIWTAHFVSPDSREFKQLRAGKGYMIDGLDYLAYSKYHLGKKPGVLWWWSGISATWDLTCGPAWEHYAKTLQTFAAEYGIDGFKYDAGDAGPLNDTLRFHDPKKEACDFVHDYIRVGAEKFPYNEYRVAWGNGGAPFMLRLPDQRHDWKSLSEISAMVQSAGLLGYPYVVADMVGGGEATTFRPGGYFSEKLFVRSAALQALHPMMQFSAAPWRYLTKENQECCRKFAELHVEFGRYIMELAHHAAKTGEPIVRSMEYEFPHQGFGRPMSQFMLGSEWLVAPVVSEDDSVTVELPKGMWKDDLGKVYTGPVKLDLNDVPLDRLPRFRRLKLNREGMIWNGLCIYKDLRYGQRGDAPGEGKGYKSALTREFPDGRICHSHRSGQYYDLIVRDGLYIPADSPIYVNLHGGAWCQAADKDGEDMDYLGGYAKRGFVVVNIDYQMQNDVLDGTKKFEKRDGATFRMMLKDIDTLVTHLKLELFPQLGIHATKIAIGGGSAGAHLSCLYAYDETCPDRLKAGLRHDLKIGFAVDVVGPTDLADENMTGPMLEHDFEFGSMFNDWVAERFTSLLGWLCEADIRGMVKRNELDRARKVLSIYSPVEMINENTCPTLLAYCRTLPWSDGDGCVPVSTFYRHMELLKKAGVPHDGDVRSWRTHGWLRENFKEWLLDRAADYASRYLKTEDAR